MQLGLADEQFILPSVQALYYAHIRLRRILSALFAMEIIAMTVIFCLCLPQVGYGLHCVTLSFPNVVAIYLCAFSLFPEETSSLTQINSKCCTDGIRAASFWPDDVEILPSCT